jgi:hypothetical protein
MKKYYIHFVTFLKPHEKVIVLLEKVTQQTTRESNQTARKTLGEGNSRLHLLLRRAPPPPQAHHLLQPAPPFRLGFGFGLGFGDFGLGDGISSC